jgi:hypothetical protein
MNEQSVMSDPQTNLKADALSLAESLRAQHNGIFVVELYLGHDGHNVCVLKDYDGEIGKGQSGKSLYHAIQRAMSDRNLRSLTATASGKKAVETALHLACEFYAKADQIDGVFNTGCFQRAINQIMNTYVNSDDCLTLLLNHEKVVQLAGGHHWLRLPQNFTRFSDK